MIRVGEELGEVRARRLDVLHSKMGLVQALDLGLCRIMSQSKMWTIPKLKMQQRAESRWNCKSQYYRSVKGDVECSRSVLNV